LFGLKDLDRWSHSLFWGLSINLFLYVGISIFTKQNAEEERQALMVVDSYSPKILLSGSSYDIRRVQDLLEQYIGRREAREVVEGFTARHGIRGESLSEKDFILLRNEAERVLSGAVGSAIATIIFEDKLTLTERERSELSNSIKQMTGTLRLSRQELAEANRNLAYLKEFSENIIESASVGIATVDSALAVKYWNREMEAITDIRKQEAFNRSIVGLLPWLTGDVFVQGRQHEAIVETPAFKSFKMNLSPLKDPSGGYVVILEDITEKKKMEEQLVQASKLASLGKLTAGISHEIGNPLASISSLVQELKVLASEPEGEDDFTAESLKTINSHIERIAKIVRSLGDFARISTREKTICSIAEILDRTIGLVKYDKRFKNIQLAAQIDDIPPVAINPDQMQQVFLNMMLNALDAMPDGGKLSVSVKMKRGSVEIVLSDTGTGIEEGVIDRIFDPFFTTKPLGKGTGLGLSICYGIIKEHNGSISVKSRKGQGAAFTIRLPVK
ncbi:MAG: ATP-binding protein, partial [Nitrospiraceae bacterium]|nr:ATP-binding protein [Nitrospiraceae bacterium]